jgi:archaellum component FlaG (FlaF/FlaG flagellin family)
MVTTLVVLVIAILIGLAISGIVVNDVYKILKLVNHETDVDVIKFDKCVLPYKR